MKSQLSLSLLLLTLAPIVSVRADSFSFNNVTQKSDVFWQLADLEARKPTGNYYLGGQNFTWCCLNAVSNALVILDNGTLVLQNNSRSEIGTESVAELRAAADRNQFPCTAKYNADPRGAPEVGIQYAWFVETCPGWSISDKSNLNAWLHSLSGFLLPAVIFCLSVPRRRKLYIFRSFFVADLAGIKSYIPAVLGALGAGLIVLFDTIIWLAICFAFAGPMILSGLYEALLDNRILDFLREKIQNKRLTLDMRCRCLMMILIGNLDLALEPEYRAKRRSMAQALALPPGSKGELSPGLATHVEPLSPPPPPPPNVQVNDPRDEYTLQEFSSNQLGIAFETNPHMRNTLNPSPAPTEARPSSIDHDLLNPTNPPSRQNPPMYRPESNSQYSATSLNRRPTAQMAASPWRHMEVLLYDIRLYDDDELARNESPRQWPRHRCAYGIECNQREHNEQPHQRTREMESHISKTKTRLRTMLHCQYSFGSIVGAPVIFFLGGFIFAFLTSLDNIGDEDIAESIAFGSWYMIIPHIAIVSGLLLAGNNPNILEGVFATERDETPDSYHILGLRFELVYPSVYKVAWQWLRGHTKKQWINQLLKTYATRTDVDFTGNIDEDDDMEDLRAKTSLSPLDWFLILSLTLLLIGVPFLLAFLTAFFTPQVGLSCRSLTFLTYFCIELAQIALWLWAYAGAPAKPASRSDTSTGLASHEDQTTQPHGFRPLDFFRKDGWLDRTGFYTPTDTDWLFDQDDTSTHKFLDIFRSEEFWSLRMFWCALYHFLEVVFGVGAVFASLGGTLMQIMGVYRTNMCYVNAQYWRTPFEQRPMVILSVNSREMIESAIVYWEPAAITAIVFMAVVSFVGWWYQRRMRDMFGELVKKIDDRKYDRDDTKAMRPLAGRILPAAGTPVGGYRGQILP